MYQLFQGNLVADYDVTKYFEAYGGAVDSQQTPGINDNLDYEKCCWWCNINEDIPGFGDFGQAWTKSFNILELKLHKKYSMKGRNSKVGISVE